MGLKYRPEIDGLRTIAVLSVIIYHAEFAIRDGLILGGGFFGVDIFFVISGFLITSILMGEYHKTGRISISNFYERRARRLLPVLFVLLLASFPFAWAFLLPEQLLDYASSLISSVFFGSNIYWHYSLQQYGAESALLKPLLHTWSLAVEEQFYIVFPLLLLALYKWCKPYALTLLIAGLMLSLQFAEWFTPINRSFSFYMLPSRFWELLAGAVLANASYLYPSSKNTLLNKVMPALGLLLIFHAVIFLDFDSRHPGFITLLPVVGTVLIIWFSSESDLVTKILSSRLFVAIGLISYSLYLWHYPIFAFGRMMDTSPSILLKWAWILLTFIMAALTYFFIEKPMKKKSVVSSSVFWGYTLAALTLIAAIIGYIFISNGGESRLDNIPAYTEFKEVEFRRLQQNGESCNARDPKNACVFGDGKFVTLGDSYVGHYETALMRKLKNTGYGLMSLNHGQCPFVSEQVWFGNHSECPAINKKRLNVINGFTDKKIILISANAEQFSKGKGRRGFSPSKKIIEKSYLSNISMLLDRGHYVVLLSGTPGGNNIAVQKWKSSLVGKIKRDKNFKEVYHSNKNIYNKQMSKSRRLLDISHKNLIKIFLPDILCMKNKNRQCLIISKEGSLYNGGGHLSSIGAEIVLDEVFSLIKEKSWMKN